jgi:hypothetical protein
MESDILTSDEVTSRAADFNGGDSGRVIKLEKPE